MILSVWILKIIRYPSTLSKKTRISLIAFTTVSIIFTSIPFCEKNDSKSDYANANFSVLGLNMPANLDFAGEPVPKNDYEIRESLEKEFFTNKSWKNSSIELFNKAQRWFPLIEPILKKEGVPDDFKYIAIIESHLSNVVSRAGACGFWQLMPTTAINYGLEVTHQVDERLDVQKSTLAACKHFKDSYKYFKNWTLSAAAYNVGIGGIQKVMTKQKTNNYYDLLLNKETGTFIYRILAYKTLLSNPTHFGVKKKIKQYNTFPNYKIVSVDSTITDLKKFATHFKTTLIELKTLNPWIMTECLENINKKTYQIRIPKNKNNNLSVYYQDVFPNKVALDNTFTNITDTIKLLPDTIKK